MRPLLCQFGCVLLVILPATLQADVPGKKYAVVVGVETYDPDQLNRLRFAVDDAEALAGELESLGFDVTLMTENAAHSQLRPTSAEKIRKVLASQAAGRASGDLLLLALTGHGVQFKTDEAGEVQEMYFCPEDAQLGDKATLLSLAEVYQILERSAAGQKLLLVDACRNDPQPEGKTRGKEIELEAVGRKLRTAPQGMLALFSCSVGETSREYPDLRHGVFTYHVLKYLRGAAEDTWYHENQLNLADLAHYVSRETRDYVWQQDHKDQIPTPYGKVSPWELGGRIPDKVAYARGSSAVARAAFAEVVRLSVNKDSRQALEKLQKFLKDFPSEPLYERARRVLGAAHYTLEDYPQAIVEYEAFLRDFPKSKYAEEVYSPLVSSRCILAQRGQPEMAAAAQRTADTYLQFFPTGPSGGIVLQSLGDMHDQLGQKSQAIACYSRILKEFPQQSDRAEILDSLSGCQLEAGQSAEGIATCDLFIQEFPKHPRWPFVRFNRLQCRFDQEDDAQTLLAEYTQFAEDKNSPLVATALYMQAKCLVRLEKYGEAGVLFAQVRTKYPKSKFATESTFQAGCQLYNAGRYQEAEGWLRAGIRECKSDAPELAHWLCQILIGQGKKAEAQALATEHIQAGGNHPFVEELQKDYSAASGN